MNRTSALLMFPGLYGCIENGFHSTLDGVAGHDTDGTGRGDITALVTDDCSPPTVPKSFAIDESCDTQAPAFSFDPTIEWQSSAHVFEVEPEAVSPYITPVVANLTDDNLDGTVDEADIPDIVYTSFADSEGYHTPGVLRVLSGDGSVVHLSLSGFSHEGQEWIFNGYGGGGIALGDLEGDGSVDIVTMVMEPDAPHDSVRVGYVAALEADGSPKWVQSEVVLSASSYPAIADMDADGRAEVVVGSLVLDASGNIVGYGGEEANGGPANAPDHGSYISFPYDIDNDGIMEVVAGNTLYDRHGNAIWRTGIPDGFSATGNFDADDRAEIVTVSPSQSRVSVIDDDGGLLWSHVRTGLTGGAPAVADLDGDGEPEIGVGGYGVYVVFDTDGTELWSQPVTDISSAMTGSSVFDFDGDGAAEIVFADEVSLTIFAGATGEVRYRNEDHQHGTGTEYPVIVDVDNDGQAEIVLGSGGRQVSTGWEGITVLGDRNDAWAHTSRNWNQHAYHKTNVLESGAVPLHAEASHLVDNDFRAAASQPRDAVSLPDLVVGDSEVCLVECDRGTALVTLSVGNAGLVGAGPYEVTVSSSAGLLHTEDVGWTSAGQGHALGPLELTQQDWGSGLFVEVDALDEVAECNEEPNTADLGPWPCQ